MNEAAVDVYIQTSVCLHTYIRVFSLLMGRQLWVKFLELTLSVNFIKNCQSVYRVETVFHPSQIHARLPAAPPSHQDLALSVSYAFRLSSECVPSHFKLCSCTIMSNSLFLYLLGIYISFLGSLCSDISPCLKSGHLSFCPWAVGIHGCPGYTSLLDSCFPHIFSQSGTWLFTFLTVPQCHLTQKFSERIIGIGTLLTL